MRASALPVEGNLVKLSVEVDEDEFDRAVQQTVRRLGGQIRVPGFRPGKVPRQVLEARLGGVAALREEAFRDALPDLYAKAVADTDLDPIATPKIDITGGRDRGPFQFDVVVEVRPTVGIAGYGGLVVTVPPFEVSDEDVDARIDRLREQSGELVVVDRPATDGDVVTIDLHGRQAGMDDLDVEDYLYEVGSGIAAPELDEHLRGTKPGDIIAYSVPMVPGADGGTHDEPGVAGRTDYRVLVKEVKQKRLPEPTDEWAREASEFETVAELRDELRARLARARRREAQLAVGSRAVEALEALVQEEAPATLVSERIEERFDDLRDGLKERGTSLDRFLEVTGQSEAQVIERLREQAVHDVRQDLALRALADVENLQVSDEEVTETIASLAQQAKVPFAQMRTRLERAGRLTEVRSDRRKAKALEWLLGHVELVDEHGAPVDRHALEGTGSDGDGSDDGGVLAADGGADRSEEPAVTEVPDEESEMESAT